MKVKYQLIQEGHRGLAQRKHIWFEMKLTHPSALGHEGDSQTTLAYTTTRGWQVSSNTNIYTYTDNKNRKHLLHMQILPLDSRLHGMVLAIPAVNSNLSGL